MLNDSSKKPRILLVDNELAVRDHIAKVLTDEYIVDTADDGAQALLAIMRARPDLVVTDAVMPGMDGIELLKTLRATPDTQMIPVLLVSDGAQDELRITGFEEGADGYLSKPYAERELRARIRALIKAVRLREESVRREVWEQAVRQAMAERAALLDSITDGFYALDREWRFTYVNQRALELIGMRREELLGKTLWETFPMLEGTIFQQQYERAMHRQCMTIVEGFSPATKLWVEARAYPTPSGLAINFRDIGERKRVEAALRQSEERYRAFVANSSEGIWRYELDEPLDLSMTVEAQVEHLHRHAYLAELNDAMARMYGYERAEDLKGTRLGALLSPTDPVASTFLRRLAECDFRVVELESAERDREGRARYFANSVTPVIEGGKLVRLWGVQRDITASKEAEACLREADRRKDEFLAVLAHELRNPLAPIRNGLQILRLRAADDEVLQRTVTMMDRQMEHLVRLVDDLLDVGRITRGRLELRTQKLQLTDVLTSAIEGSRALIEAQGHHLTVSIDDADDLVVEGDSDRLVQVFSNLLSNSAKYTERGGRISLTAAREGTKAVVQVQDSGIGIPREALDHVFDMFSQVRSHQGRAGGGLGIGLSLVRTLVALHGGSVTAFSEGPGTGSTFTVRLPVCAPRHERSHVSDYDLSSQAASYARRLRILIADDNEDAASSLATLLKMQGHEVCCASDGLEAIEWAREFRPEVVFMDIGMPRLDGIEAARRIRALPHGESMRIIALTGWGQPQDEQRTRAAGMDHHLTKPVSTEALRSVLNTLRVQ